MKVLKIVLMVMLLAGLATQVYAAGSYGENRETMVIEGSTTVLPIAQAAAESFMSQNPGVDVTVRGGGSGVGIASLIDGTCDIADSSRPIKDAELDKAITNGRSPKAFVVAMDGICVVVNSSNSINALTKKQVKDIYTGSISNWKELGGSDQKIVVVSRDSSSGTFEAFGALALDGAKVRPDALMQASNQALASIVARTPGAIAYIGLGYLSSSVKAVDVDGVKASKDTVLTNKYPLGRPLFMYTNGKPSGVVEDFIEYVLSKEGQKLVEQQGFIGLK